MRRRKKLGLLLSSTLAAQSWHAVWASEDQAPKDHQQDSTAAEPGHDAQHAPQPGWPEPPTAHAGAPNIVLILVDDVGFGTTSAFGGPIATPNFDRLAASGLKYNNFHVNSLCSPTRSALLTGYNNHEVGFGTVAEAATDYPGYNTLLPEEITPVAEVLKENGYSTAAVGKWHNTPTWQVSPAGPFDRWPTGRWGFEHFYGFMSGADNQYYTRLYRDTTPVEPSATPEQGYHFTTDITNEAIKWLHEHDAVAHDKPFFLYYATGATHEPHQVAQKWIEKYKGKFDQGWDVIRQQSFERQKKLGVIPANAELTPRPSTLPAWDSLTPDQKKLLAHQAEVYAGFAEQTDYEIGRLIDTVREEGQADNTIFIEIFGDNGASAEGGFEGHDAQDVNGKPLDLAARLDSSGALGSEVYMNHFAAAWAWALTSPFQGTKQDASHLGGTTDPLVISWAGHIADKGGLRSQFAHVNDIAPTLYQLADIAPPSTHDGVKQLPIEGTSLAYTFDHPNEPSHHHVQYFATSGNRGIYKDGWWAGDLYHETWENNAALWSGNKQDPDTHPWELYNLNEDYSQAHNLAATHPEKLKELQALFAQEAERNHVYPLLPGVTPYPIGQGKGQKVFTYRAGVDRIVPRIAPNISGHAYTITADVDIPASGAQGVIFAQGSRYGGVTLYVKDNRVVYEINAHGNRSGEIVASDPLTPGKAHIVVDVTPHEPLKKEATVTRAFYAPPPTAGTGQLSINGKAAGQADFANVVAASNETLDIGSDLGSPVSQDYQSPNRFTGTIDTVSVEIH
ncbi:arylsulfatase [Silvibacterium sp.]|uniref:arylsulfatase n=1 Tax=Silvibacterium sp. TaxID=1964179 RepID=UPI0039E429B9